MASLSLRHIYKIYQGDVTAVKDFNLEIEDKEFIVFVGPSGCGKSTTLRMIAGLEDISKGELYIGDTLVNDVEPKERDIAMVFQNYALYPHMSVYDNMAFALKLRKMPKDEIEKKVTEAAKILDIEHLLKRKPKALSGGQRQRVALGRAIVRNPKVFLMDEPLSNLDAKLRVQMRTEISKLYRKLQTTFIYVTHDQVEAMTMGTRIVVMKDGIIQQVDTPQNIYNYPTNLFVAGFMGSPQMNFIEGVVEKSGNDLFASFNGNKIITGSAGGCFLTDDEEAANKVRKWSTQARENAAWYQHEELGYNYRMSNVVAGVVRGQFPYLNEHIAQKKTIYERYKEGLKGLPVSMNPMDLENTQPNYWLSCLIIDKEAMCKQVRGEQDVCYVKETGKSCPTEILEAIASINAEGRPIWKPMHMQPIYRLNPFVVRDGNGRARSNAYIAGGVADVGMDIFTRGLCLPSYNKMTVEQKDRIIEVIKKCFE